MKRFASMLSMLLQAHNLSMLHESFVEGMCHAMQGVVQLLRHLTPLVQQGNLVEQLEDVIDDKTTNEVLPGPAQHNAQV